MSDTTLPIPSPASMSALQQRDFATTRPLPERASHRGSRQVAVEMLSDPLLKEPTLVGVHFSRKEFLDLACTAHRPVAVSV